MTPNQVLILSGNSFTGKPDEKGVVKVFNSLLVAKADAHDRIGCSTLYVDDSIYKSFDGIGIYECQWAVYFDNKGNTKTRISGIKKVRAIEL